jgi:hypothetical protein
MPLFDNFNSTDGTWRWEKEERCREKGIQALKRENE